ncbi:MAG: hypothetical protein K5790_10280 [Nitrosopumilus sp.]|uniref:hypothetical protein n=1 Tax=Nitrosopumilus sp. TaxID=2024843 RepID=UPI00247BB50D|nr:hypothetical protein [Nitrosopumilus sp.]MCV0393656.1 hypothetical protein [Nitrosopumilus sp.]
MIRFGIVDVGNENHDAKISLEMNGHVFILDKIYPKAVAEKTIKAFTEEQNSWESDFHKLFYYTVGDSWAITDEELNNFLMKHDTMTPERKCSTCNETTKRFFEMFDEKTQRFLKDKIRCPKCYEKFGSRIEDSTK